MCGRERHLNGSSHEQLTIRMLLRAFRIHTRVAQFSMLVIDDSSGVNSSITSFHVLG